MHLVIGSFHAPYKRLRRGGSCWKHPSTVTARSVGGVGVAAVGAFGIGGLHECEQSLCVPTQPGMGLDVVEREPLVLVMVTVMH